MVHLLLIKKRDGREITMRLLFWFRFVDPRWREMCAIVWQLASLMGCLIRGYIRLTFAVIVFKCDELPSDFVFLRGYERADGKA
jgi:hypothetical protein